MSATDTARRIILEQTVRGEHTGVWEGLTPTFRHIEVPVFSVYEVDIVTCVRDAAAAVTGRQPAEAGVVYWMDAAIVSAAGVPTLNYGRAGTRAHEAVEWVELDSVIECAPVLVESAPRFLGTPAATQNIG